MRGLVPFNIFIECPEQWDGRHPQQVQRRGVTGCSGGGISGVQIDAVGDRDLKKAEGVAKTS